MLKGTREFIKIFFPIIESLLISWVLGRKLDETLAAVIVIFIFMLFVNYTYSKGYYIRIFGWGAIGLTIGPQFFLITNSMWCVTFVIARYLFFRMAKI